MTIEGRIAASGLYLPGRPRLPRGVMIDFAWARIYGDRAFLSGHGPRRADGSFARPFGRVGAEVTLGGQPNRAASPLSRSQPDSSAPLARAPPRLSVSSSRQGGKVEETS